MTRLFMVSYAVLWILVVMMALLLLLVYRHFGPMAMSTGAGHERDGLPIGREAPSISGVDRDNNRVHWTPAKGRHSLVVFVAPGCGPCEEIAPYLGALAQAVDQSVQVVAVAAGRGEEVQALEASTGHQALCIADDGSGAMSQWEVRVTPFALLVGPDTRVVTKGNCSNPALLRRLLDSAGLAAAVESLDGIVSTPPAAADPEPAVLPG